MKLEFKKVLASWLPMLRVFKRFLPFVKEEKRRLTLATICMVFGTATTLATPLPIALVFDGVLFRKRATGLSEVVKEIDHVQGTPTALAMLCAAYLGILALDALFDYLRAVLAATAAQRIVYKIRRATFENLLRQPVGFFQAQRGGDLLLRLTGDIAMLRDLLVPSVLEAAQQAAVLVGMILVILCIAPKLALVAVGVIPLLTLAFVRGSKKLSEVSREQRKREGKLAAWAAEAFHAIGIVQVFNREEDVAEQFSSSNRKSLKAGVEATRVEARIGRAVDILTGVGTCGVLIWGAFEVRALRLSAGDLLVIMTYLRQVYKPLRTLGKVSARTAKAATCGERVLEVLSLESPIRDAADARPVNSLHGNISFENVVVSHGRGQRALDGVSVEIRAGERVAIVGPSGAGKSTFLTLVPRLMDPTSGVVRVDGLDVRSLRLRDLREQVAFAMQEPGLLGETLRENVAFGRLGASGDEVAMAARRAGVDLIARTRPEGLDAPVSERGASLSGGERQRVALARVALRNAPIVLLDEPFSALDPQRQAALEEALAPLLEGRTALVVTHRLERLSQYDRVLVVSEGRIVGDGPPQEVSRTCALLRAMLAAQGVESRHDVNPLEVEAL
ncbi:MAG: ABC transporter ATP-binding protein [Planctomycetes bacterium]|nr:ABC transporter ATP-binding protein [Planctomycetota bacterium]